MSDMSSQTALTVSSPLHADAPLYPQLVPAVPLWTNGKESVQQHDRPGPDYFRMAVKVK